MGLSDRRTQESWDRLFLESAGRMAEHDGFPRELRDVSNDEGLLMARDIAATQNDFLAGLFA